MEEESMISMILKVSGRCAVPLLMAATLGCASADLAAPAGRQPLTGNRFHVERNGISKKVSFQDLDSSQTLVMKYKGIPIAFGSPLNLIVDEDIYEKRSHRVRYRFLDPLSAQPMEIVARATSQAVHTVPIHSEDGAPLVRLFAGQESRGTLKYDYDSRVLFSGELQGRPVEIERISEDTALDRGLLKYFLFPFPLAGEFVIRVDGREAARFIQGRQHGVTSPYELSLESDLDPATRNDAMLSFVVFDLMKEFVQSSAG
jgi:hypothetical protein